MGVQEVGGAAEQGNCTEKGCRDPSCSPERRSGQAPAKAGPPRAAVPLMVVMSLLLPKWHNASKKLR